MTGVARYRINRRVPPIHAQLGAHISRGKVIRIPYAIFANRSRWWSMRARNNGIFCRAGWTRRRCVAVADSVCGSLGCKSRKVHRASLFLPHWRTMKVQSSATQLKRKPTGRNAVVDAEIKSARTITETYLAARSYRSVAAPASGLSKSLTNEFPDNLPGINGVVFRMRRTRLLGSIAHHCKSSTGDTELRRHRSCWDRPAGLYTCHCIR